MKERQLAGQQLPWYGYSLFTLDTLGAHVLGSSLPRSGRCRTVHMVLLWELLRTGWCVTHLHFVPPLGECELTFVKNNFIVGQVTPDMLVSLEYGTYILFGLLTFAGAAFIYFFVPETKRLTLEEMDVIFGSEGTAQADFERMEEINREIGLDRMLGGERSVSASEEVAEKSEKFDHKEF